MTGLVVAVSRSDETRALGSSSIAATAATVINDLS